MPDWNKLVPDEPLFDREFIHPSSETTPPAVKNWCLISIAANAVIATLVTLTTHHAASLLMGAFFSVLPLVMLFYWRDVASATASRTYIGPQWFGIGLCLGCTSGLCLHAAVEWFKLIKG